MFIMTINNENKMMIEAITFGLHVKLHVVMALHVREYFGFYGTIRKHGIKHTLAN